MPRKGLPGCDCSFNHMGRLVRPIKYWTVKENIKSIWIQCQYCGEMRRTYAKTGIYHLEQRPANWRDVVNENETKWPVSLSESEDTK